jgi:branched-chain amino acid aminotransferase
MTVVWVDGQLRSRESARVSALDHGLTVGNGVFETCRVDRGMVFALTRHLRRLRHSASVLGFAPVDEAQVREAVEQTLAVAEPADLFFGRLRITLTEGQGLWEVGARQARRTLVVTLSPAVPWDAPAVVATVPWTRNERSAVAGAKTTSYAENLVARRAARAVGADEALLANTRGMLCEGAGSNVFVRVAGVLITPPLSSGCLAGVTRELVLQWAAEEGVPVAERDLPMGELAGVTEAVLTSSLRGVHRVGWLDGRELVQGELTDRVTELFARRSDLEADP